MKVLVTGAAGFIGSALTLRLLERGDTVIGIDNHNDYYSPALKEARLARQANHPNYTHIRMDMADRPGMAELFKTHKPQRVVNLAAQAGVRYSLENPLSYIDSNLVGFGHILEGCRHNGVEHLVYASSSSVYGANTTMPFSVHHNVDHPLSLYAATKKANELMAHTYSHLYGLPTTGLRFFTVYGPWGRPDMALFLFTKAILEGRPIDVFNHGRHRRDFTYVDDIVEGIIRTLDRALDQARDRAGIRKEELKGIFLVGGSSLLPGIEEKIREFFPLSDVHAGNPFEAIARGACRYSGGIFDQTLTHDYCLRSWNRELRDFELVPVVPRGTPYPTGKPVCSKYIKAASDNQETLGLVIYERSSMSRPLITYVNGADGLRPVREGEREESRQKPLNPEDSEFIHAVPPCRSGERRFIAGFGVDSNRRLTLWLRDTEENNSSYILLRDGSRLPLPVSDLPVVKL
jgi:nucleoside-diphosphate-sugar epimerase